jgi:DNA-binding transcriptional regulator YdaS (Cro superfamily)
MNPMAEAAADLMDQVARLDPKAAAQRLIDAQKQRRGWLDEFAEQLDRQRNADALERILAVWGLNQSDAARIFGVSRQAISKWLAQGVPAERAEAIADVAAATDLLVHHLKRDRIPAVVRRRAAALGNTSLLALLERKAFREMLEACRDMFAFGEAHR